MALRLSPRRFLAVVSSIGAFYSLMRVVVLFFEALSIVSAERAEDSELLNVCSSGQAQGSAKLRDACLKARASLAAPVVFKAVTYAVSSAFKDFSDAVGSPMKVLVLLMFVVFSVVLPIMPWAKALLGQPIVEPAPIQGLAYVSYAPEPTRRSFRRRVKSAMPRLLRAKPTIDEYDDFEQPTASTNIEIGHWQDVNLRPKMD
jgi:hypothetical protein